MMTSRKILIMISIILGMYLFLIAVVTNRCVDCYGLKINVTQSEYCDRNTQRAYSAKLTKE
jgi:hypothetical protein